MVSWNESAVDMAGGKLHVRRGGNGRPLLVVHRDIGTLDRLPFYDGLAERFDVLIPDHPGYGKSERAAWMRHPRDIAVIYRGLLADMGLKDPILVGLGFGGWIAAEMATMSPGDLGALVLVGPMGIKPPEGDILDQALLSYIDYARAFFSTDEAFAASYGEKPSKEPSTDQLVEWDVCREMNFRIAWKPYMFSLSLPHLLGSIKAPTVIAWGEDDKVVPRSAATLWQKGLPHAKLEIVPACGAAIEMEKPDVLTKLVASVAGNR